MSTETDERMLVEIWSDFICPFSYMGEHKLRAGIARSGVDVRLVFRSYQLRPDLPADTDVDFVAMMAERRGLPIDKVRARTGGAAAQAAELGLQLRYDHTRATNTRRAHALAHFARAHGHADAMIERLFKAYFTDGLLISDPQTLANLAADVGLYREQAITALSRKDLRGSGRRGHRHGTPLRCYQRAAYRHRRAGRTVGSTAPETFAAALREARAN